jgi:Family of unknown function (DUF6118)
MGDANEEQHGTNSQGFLPSNTSGRANRRKTLIGQDRWNAGVTMMQTADPGGWRGVVNAPQLARDNAEAIGRCAEAARTASADQRCAITVKARAQ